MEYIKIKTGSVSAVKMILGIFNLIIATLLFIYFFKTGKSILYIVPAIIALSGIYMATNGFSLERSWIRTGSNSITVKWFDRILPIQIHNNSVARITLERTRIMIDQKNRKPNTFALRNIEKDQRTEIYNFLIEFCKKRDIILVKHSNTLL